MKRTYYILLVLVLLTSCNTGNQLEGIWIGAYKSHNYGDTPSYSSMRLLLDISKNEIVLKTFDYPMFEEKDSIRKSKYSINKNNLIFDSDTFLIKGIAEDSLILSIKSDYELDFVLKKLPEKIKKQNIDIQNNAFSLIGPNYADSIDFINDSLILHIGNVFNTNYRLRKWAINSYKSLDFLVFDQIESPPLLIDKCFDNEVSLKLYSTTIKDFKMTRIDNLMDTNRIVGNWVSPFKNNTDLPIPPPPPNYSENVDTKLYLRIKKDSLEIEQFGRTNSKKWMLNSTKEFIYFPWDLLTKDCAWRILEIDGDELKIERNNKFSSSGKEIIEFERIKNSR